MGILTSLLVVFVVAIIWGAVPGVAADPFQIPAELAAIMPGFGDGVVRPESQYTVILPQAVDNVRSFVSDMVNTITFTLSSLTNLRVAVCSRSTDPSQLRQHRLPAGSTAASARPPVYLRHPFNGRQLSKPALVFRARWLHPTRTSPAGGSAF